MEREKYTGIELLERIKLDYIPNNTIVKVIKEDKVVCYLKIEDKEVLWKTKSFRLSMLVNDDYKFELLSVYQVRKALQDLDIDNEVINHLINYMNTLVFNV